MVVGLLIFLQNLLALEEFSKTFEGKTKVIRKLNESFP